jgi:hypothetical protein
VLNTNLLLDSSTVSNTGIHLHSLLNAEDSPSRPSVTEMQMHSKHNLHVGSLPITKSHTDLKKPPQTTSLPSFNSAFDHRVSQASLDTNSLLDSRRSSVDSRMNSSIAHLALNGPTSPYDLACFKPSAPTRYTRGRSSIWKRSPFSTRTTEWNASSSTTSSGSCH